ncbi:hypothetical protein Fmac_005894 [Flemingia macrophylla]|uniref:Uncharacterized protein n=1 Tax=Flemingia macrophylla TaxID=520843 RepID=A0ABD1N984_9FABA
MPPLPPLSFSHPLSLAYAILFSVLARASPSRPHLDRKEKFLLFFTFSPSPSPVTHDGASGGLRASPLLAQQLEELHKTVAASVMQQEQQLKEME